MQLIISRDILLNAINLISKASDKRHNIAVLANIKLSLTESKLELTASDLEVELQATLNLPEGACQQVGEITLPANKFKDIIKLLPDSSVTITVDEEHQCHIVCGKSHFKLSTLPARDFPLLGKTEQGTPVQLGRDILTNLLEKTHFAIAIQDVRHYLTGMLFELKENQLNLVATDGHRLAVARTLVENTQHDELTAIVPRKAVLELQRLLIELKKYLPNHDNLITLHVGNEFLHVMLPFGEMGDDGQLKNPILVTFTSRLIEGKFPDYRRVMPTNTDKSALINVEQLNDVLRRVSVLSHEKSRGVLFHFKDAKSLELITNNSEHDEAREQLNIKYQGEILEISFNVSYLLDVLNKLQGTVEFNMSVANGSVLVRQINDSFHEFVVMPIRL